MNEVGRITQALSEKPLAHEDFLDRLHMATRENLGKACNK
jgi:hypothetical protein